jgi:hypothetical protein
LNDALEPAVRPDPDVVEDEFDFPFVTKTGANSSAAAHRQSSVIHAFDARASYE